MSHINITVDPERDLTIHTVNGILLPTALHSGFIDFYNGSPTKYLLWDLTNADMCQIKGEDIKHIVKSTKEYAHLRPNGKTAWVATRDLNFGLSRQYSVLGEVFEHPIKIASFRDYDSAIDWLFNGK
jgi:hypothetical protein